MVGETQEHFENERYIQGVKSSITAALFPLLKGRVPIKDYTIARANVPLPSVDFILTRFSEKEIGLITRQGSALKGERWFFGGRQFLGETQADALIRVMREEAGLTKEDIVSTRESHNQDLFVPASITNAGEPLGPGHMLMHLHVVDVKHDFLPASDGTWSNFKWYKPEKVMNTDEHLLPDLVLALKLAKLI